MMMPLNIYLHRQLSHRSPLYITLITLFILVIGLEYIQGQINLNDSSCNESTITKKVSHPSPLPIPYPSTKASPFQRNITSIDPISVNFSIDWTNCQIHILNANQPIEITLNGDIASPNPVRWILESIPQGSTELPNLTFIADVLDRTGSTYGSDIPLIWEISLNGGPFLPMNMQPDNTISTVFAPGAHTFQVRISGVAQNHLNNGYFRLQLAQRLIPEM